MRRPILACLLFLSIPAFAQEESNCQDRESAYEAVGQDPDLDPACTKEVQQGVSAEGDKSCFQDQLQDEMSLGTELTTISSEQGLSALGARQAAAYRLASSKNAAQKANCDLYYNRVKNVCKDKAPHALAAFDKYSRCSEERRVMASRMAGQSDSIGQEAGQKYEQHAAGLAACAYLAACLLSNGGNVTADSWVRGKPTQPEMSDAMLKDHAEEATKQIRVKPVLPPAGP